VAKKKKKLAKKKCSNMSKARRKPVKRAAAKRPALKNPGKLKKVTRSSGWLKADAVKFVKKGGKTEVYIRRGKPRRKRAK
jgi:hypothetical protein